MEPPEIRYARSGDVSIAYTVTGERTPDIVFVHGFLGNQEVEWEIAESRAFFDRLASFGRLVTFDRRGTGLSDRVREVPTLETRMDDVRAVLDAVGSRTAVLFGTVEAAAMCVLFAATYPERTAGLILFAPSARGTWAPDYPWAPTDDEWADDLRDFAARWGEPEVADAHIRAMAPSRAADERFRSGIARLMRQSASPGSIVAIRRMARAVDVRDVLPAVGVPTLVVTPRADAHEQGAYVARRIPGARHVRLESSDFLVTLQGEPLYAEVERFVGSLAAGAAPDTVLATVLFTDIVGSTEKAATLGDRRWAETVEAHHALVRRVLDRFRGTEVDTAGDGFFASFDGPIRAIRCADAIGAAVADLDLVVRAGLHTGECERVGEKIGGLAVNIGARVAALAAPGEVLVTSTVKDLVAGSDLEFAERGEHELKGVPGTWRLYAVA